MVTSRAPSAPESPPIQRVTFGLGQPIAIHVTGDSVTSNNGTFHLHTDHLGSTSYLTKSTGSKVSGSDARYQPFGPYRTTPTQTITDTGYTGQHHNPSLGLIYFNARYYAPALARFISPDTIVPDPAGPQTFNRYSYTRNNPTRFTDPTGHISCDSVRLPEDDQFTCATTPPPPAISYAAQACAGWDLIVCNDPTRYPSNELINALAETAYAYLSLGSKAINMEILRLRITMLVLAGYEYGLSSEEIAYMLATAAGESRFGAITEGPMATWMWEDISEPEANTNYSYNTDKGRELGNLYEGDGWKFRGRGFVQLTGRGQYKKVQEKFGNRYGVDLITNPDVAAQNPRLAAEIAAYGMLSGSFSTYSFADAHAAAGENLWQFFLSSRRIINGTFKAEGYACIALNFYNTMVTSNSSGCSSY